MKSILVDWGQWDDTYKFINKKNQEYIDSNVTDSAMENLKLKNMIYLNNNNKIVYDKECNIENGISEEFMKKLSANNRNFDKISYPKVGVLSLKNKVYIVGILSITPTDSFSNSNGTLIMIREIDEDLLAYMENISNVNLVIEENHQENYKSKDYKDYINLENNIITYNKKSFDAYKIIQDVNGEKLISISIISKSYNDEAINYFSRNFIFWIIILATIIIITDIIIVDKYMLKRLSKLTGFIEKVGVTKDTTLTVTINGKDEIYRLSNAINKMLSEINSANEEILFLSYTDKLTGLKNRAYMEKIFKSVDEEKEDNYHIIMGDLNGLKLTNDALSHFEGDRLLCIISEILTKSCKSDDTISRWGGDEFVILVKNKDINYIIELMKKIKHRCENETEFHVKISIALGSAGSYEKNSRAEEILSLAEKRMYRNKLLEEKSARSATIHSLLRTLHEKHSETEEHTIRIKNLSVKLGKRIGLSKDKLDELELLSTLHDIGKIGIPEQVLMKPSKLTDEEWTIMKTHSEIGYRIASSTPELAHIANCILAHHERYDGTGYPNKLKGDEIPLLSRIINVVDSYDVMTHKRVYKEAFEKNYVIEELKRCSGTQFDPVLVKGFIDLLEQEGLY